MDKPAPTDRPILDALARRFSGRAIDPDKPVAREVVLSALEAARWAPSAGNSQPWRFLVFDAADPDARQAARGCLTDGNAWARKAPVLVLTVAAERREKDQSPNAYASHDLGLATENLLVQTVASGLVAHPMAGFDADRARTLFAIPDGFGPTAMVAIGHPGDPAALPDDLRERELAPRKRRPLSEICFAGRWGRLLDG